jgi:Gnt-I system high-affinity gluconate transporter
MSAILGIVMLLAFIVAVWVIFRGTSPIIVLLALAIVWTLLAGSSFRDLLANVLQKGGEQYASTIVIIVFGAWFGQVLVQTGIAESMIRTAVELAGDKPIAVTWAVSLITGLLFTSIYGVGAAISIGVIAIPIMLSLGIPPRVAAPAFTMAIGAGNYLNPVEFGIFKSFFKGIEYGGSYFAFYLCGFIVYLLAAFAMSAWNLRGVQVRRASAVGVATAVAPRVRVPWLSYLSPAIPVIVIIAFKWPLIPAFLLAIVFALATTQAGRTPKQTVDLFHKAFYDAFPDIATIAALWIVCGMLIVAGQLEAVKAVLNPIFAPVIPHTPFQAALFFAALAPLAIYRGPFSIIGTGAALLAVMLNANFVSPVFLYLVWRGPLCLQGSQDPTNSWTLWTIGYTKVTHPDFLKTALPWGWLMVAVNAFIAYFMFGGMFGQ